MNKINFTKMVASGNDFVVVDELKTNLHSLARRVCERKTGIGADGMLTIKKKRVGHFNMRIFNPDGSEAEMCGNGIRCLAKFVYENEIVKKKSNHCRDFGWI